MWDIFCIKIKSSEKISETESNLENAIHRAHDTHGIVACLWWRVKKKKDWRWKKSVISQKSEALLQKILFLSDADSDD